MLISILDKNHLASSIYLHILRKQQVDGSGVPMSRKYYARFATTEWEMRKAIQFMIENNIIYVCEVIQGIPPRRDTPLYRINKEFDLLQAPLPLQESSPYLLDNEVISNQYKSKQNQKTKNQPDLRRGSASHPHADRQPKPEEVKEPPPVTDDEAVEMIVQMFGPGTTSLSEPHL